MEKFKYVSLFSGIGGFEQALNRLGGECVLASEIDKFANKSYSVLYGEETAGDITAIRAADVPDHDILVGGFPCQAFSVAGKRQGFADTRGTLFFEVARIASEKQPKMLLLENVKGLVGHDKGQTLDTIVRTLNDIGYHVDFEVLNSKYFGVPQNRERIFIVALRDDLAKFSPWVIKGTGVVAKGKKRISGYEGVKSFNFDWPEQTEVTTRLRDVLEQSVDERYYLSDEKTARLVAELNGRNQNITKLPAPLNLVSRGAESKSDGIAYALKAAEGGSSKQHLLDVGGLPIREATKQGYAIAEEGDAVNFQFPDSRTRRGRVGKQIANTLEASNINQGVVLAGSLDHYGNDQMNRVYDPNGIAPTLTVPSGGGREQKIAEEVRATLTPERLNKRQNGPRFKESDEPAHTVNTQDRHGVAIGSYPRYRIRKLTPLETWRLQGFPDEAHNAVREAGVSDSQRYKQAGNAVTVNVIHAIGERLLTYLDGPDSHNSAEIEIPGQTNIYDYL